MARNLSAGSIPTRRHQYSVSGESDVEDYSLTYLKYKNYFTNAPLVRCLDKSEPHQKTNSFTAPPSPPLDPVDSKDGLESPGTYEDGEDESGRQSKRFEFIQRDEEEVKAF
jgi:hypothetical protein